MKDFTRAMISWVRRSHKLLKRVRHTHTRTHTHARARTHTHTILLTATHLTASRTGEKLAKLGACHSAPRSSKEVSLKLASHANTFTRIRNKYREERNRNNQNHNKNSPENIRQVWIAARDSCEEGIESCHCQGTHHGHGHTHTHSKRQRNKQNNRKRTKMRQANK